MKHVFWHLGVAVGVIESAIVFGMILYALNGDPGIVLLGSMGVIFAVLASGLPVRLDRWLGT